ncbi:MAG TPA: patatin-like phospholipase family protein [Pyrinomonadaceae bacterium]|nr:patatin-like phospholipase family protein [Pyrinomonadaceae bacterium]
MKNLNDNMTITAEIKKIPNPSKINARKWALFLTCMLILITSLPALFGQEIAPTPEIPQKERRKIGLVLSGGGARGFAHIGVLKVLEENRIPVDYVAGASMGGLVGALYATGRTPDEMERLIETLDWDNLLRGRTAFEALSYRRKEDRRNLPGAITLGGKGANLNLPGSLNPGHEIGLALDRLMFSYGDKTDFDNLPIPFRAAATDLVNAETVVLKDGSLAQALRATMAIPGVFAPVELNGKILADGGILNNIPTDVAKQMGADIIIVVNIETQLGDRAALQDLVGILGQTFYVATIENSRRSLRQADFIIAPDLENYTTFDFTAGKEIVELGYAGAQSKVSLLKSLALDDADWQRHLAARRARMRPDVQAVPEFLAIEGTTDAGAKSKIERELGGRYENKPLDKEALEKDLTRLTGTERFDNLGYGTTGRAGETGLSIRVYDPVERTGRTTILQVGVDVNNSETDDVNFNARARLTFFDAGGEGNEWRNDFSIGSRTLLATEFFRPFGRGKFFAAPNAFYEDRKVNFYENGDRLAEYSFRTAQAGIDFGYAVNRNSELRLGYSIGHQKAARRIGSPLLSDLSGKVSFASLRWNYDTRDNAQIPKRGIETRNSLNYYFDSPGAGDSFAQAESRINAFRPLGEKNIVFGFGGGGTTFGERAPLFQQFSVGGLFNVGGYGTGEFRGGNYLNGGFGALRETFAAPPYIGGKLYLGGWYEAGSSFESINTAKYRQSVTFGTLLETRIGPIFVGGSFAEGGRRKIYFSLGRFF